MTPALASEVSRSSRRHPRLVALALAGLTAVACGGDRSPSAGHEEAAAPTAAAVEVRTAAVAPLEEPAGTASGTVYARQRATLTARLATAVRALPVEEGAAVRAGQVVVRLDDTSLRASLAAAEAERGAAVADANRYARLLEREAATPREAEGAAARAAGAAAAVAAARDGLAYSELRAPFAGRLARRLVREGDVVTPGQALVEVEGDGAWELRAAVDGAAAAALAPGQRLTTTIDGVGEVPATVRVVSPAGDPGTHRFEVVADLEPVAGLRSGQFARLGLAAPAAAAGEAAMGVPVAAVFPRGGLTGVFVVEDGRARLRWIAVGERRGDLVVVRAGLNAGERVILVPGGLVDGAAVTEVAP